jgi:hypothetical protein
MHELPTTWPTSLKLTPVERARVSMMDASRKPEAARAKSSVASGSKVPAASDLSNVER